MAGAGWPDHGLCGRFPDVNFAPDPLVGESSRPAKNVCVHCPVSNTCRTQRDEHPALGVWGGEDEADYVRRVGAPASVRCDECSGVALRTAVGVVCTACGVVS